MDVYKRPYDPKHPVVCMDESPKQLIAETKIPMGRSPGKVAKHDYEYKRCGVCNIFMASEWVTQMIAIYPSLLFSLSDSEKQ